MNFKLFISVTALTLLSACGTSAKNLALISPGMSKENVIQVLGKPESVTGEGSREAFVYTLSNSWNSPVWNEEYIVYFYDGKVVRYGK